MWAQLYDGSHSPPLYYGECTQFTDNYDWSDAQQACAELFDGKQQLEEVTTREVLQQLDNT